MLSTTQAPNTSIDKVLESTRTGSPEHLANMQDLPHPWDQALRLVQQRQIKLRESIGIIKMDDFGKLSGIEALLALQEGRAPTMPMGRTLNFHLMQVKVGEVIFQGQANESVHNVLGTVHAGWYATLIESALSGAVHTMLESGQWHTALSLNVHLVHAANAQSGPLRAKACVLHFGAQTANANAELVDYSGKLYAHGSASFKIHTLSS